MRFDLFLRVLSPYCIQILETRRMHDRTLSLDRLLFRLSYDLIVPLLNLFELLAQIDPFDSFLNNHDLCNQ